MIVAKVIESGEGKAQGGVRVKAALGAAPAIGDPSLVERLAANLVDNAIHHNRESGWVTAWTGVRDGRPTLEVENAGPVIRADQIAGLMEPFRQIGGDRTGDRRGLGLGLSIVSAIAAAHGADLNVKPRADGGLSVAVSFLAARSF